MKPWTKKHIAPEHVRSLQHTYGLDALTASIFVRRGITKGSELVYYLENDLRYTHNPFLFAAMEDAVDRITDALEEGEKILIFGDSDVDGVSSTAILYTYLKNAGADVRCRIPTGNDGYGLSIAAVDDFARDYGSLIITVDCGISNVQEIAHAAEQGIDVIVVDHHNPPAVLPTPAVIIDPKLPDSGYPFDGISGAALAYKLVTALRFSTTSLYKQDICLLTADEQTGTFTVQCRKLRNLLEKDALTLTFSAPSSVAKTPLAEFLSGQQIFVWDERATKTVLANIFGRGVEFNVADIRPSIATITPQLAQKPLMDILASSHAVRYQTEPAGSIDALTSIFVATAWQQLTAKSPDTVKTHRDELELVTLAAIADIMPLTDENRILVRAGLSAFNSGHRCPGLMELFALLRMNGAPVSAKDLSWSVIPALNAAGRMGTADVALTLLTADDAATRERCAAEIISLNEKRKALVSQALTATSAQAAKRFTAYNQKLCMVIDESINKGITGIVASRLMNAYTVPAIAVTVEGGVATGSLRSCRSFKATAFLSRFGDFFINYGGHDAAAGFSFAAEKLDEFETLIARFVPDIHLSDTDDVLTVDAELPARYLTPDVLKTVDLFEPFGAGSPPLLFVSHALPVVAATIVGKTEPRHLKLTLDAGRYKFPALYWRNAERLNRDFQIGDTVDVLYSIERNSFNGTVTPQLVVSDIEKTKPV
ncbi:MAG: single-stranded-DNA-specific exonuclease RecJ [Treponema sp.]|nr:single-stranded-DNA-specific exonuclease RecJ [Treponema sp.]